ncbi:hypothetical protein FS837_008565 [Tulasnella sp. UAMH 9824]|nr:hypothetical protein FS837_008565 [Tulasnella sp. UAMH 9824]
MSTPSVSDLYNFYSETLHDHPSPGAASRTNSVDMPALSALSNIFLKTHPDDGQHEEQHSEPANLPVQNGRLESEQPSGDQLYAHHGSETSEQESPISDGRDVIDPDPTMRFPSAAHGQLFRKPTLPSSRANQGVEAGQATTTEISPNSNPTDANPTSPSSPTFSAMQKPVANPVMPAANASLAYGDMSRSIASRAGQMPGLASSPTTPGSMTTGTTISNSSILSRSRSNSTAASATSYFSSGAHPAGSSYIHSTPVSRSNSIAAKGHSPYAPPSELPPLPQHQQQQLSHSLTPRQSPTSSPKPSPAGVAAPAPQTSAATSPGASPYSQPIPRPHRARNDALHSLHRGSSISGGSHSSPPSSHFSRSSGSPPIPSTATTANTRKSAASRQSGLRSSIVSGEMEWEDGERNRYTDATMSSGIASNEGHISHAFGDEVTTSAGTDYGRSASPGPSTTSTSSAFRAASSLVASSRPPSGYQDSGRGSGYGFHTENSTMTADTSAAQSVASSPQQLKRNPSLHSRPSRSNLQQQLAMSPSNGPGLGLSRSTSSGSLMGGGVSRPNPGQRTSPGGRGLSRTTSATALNASARSSSGTNLNQLGKVGQSYGLSRSNSYSARSVNFPRGESPEPPVPPLPANVQSMVEQTDVPIGMAATADEPVQVSKRVNRSRASSVTNQDGAAAYNPTLSSGRTSWGGHPPPPPHLTAQRSSEWGPLPEDDGEVSVSGTSTDLEGDADLEEDEGDHTYNPSHRRQSKRGLQNGESLADSGFLPAVEPDVRPVSERTARYSVGSSIADENEWETDESGRKYRKPAPLRTDAEATDVSEMSDSDFDEVAGRKKNLEQLEEERTAAIIVAEEGQAVMARRGYDSLEGFEVKPGTTHLEIPHTTTPELAPSFLDNVLSFIPSTLLALDISGNQLTSLPLGLAECRALGELKISNNPLRTLPPWLSNLRNLQIFIADFIDLEFLPNELSTLSGLQLISLRNNNLHSLPGWLCLLNDIEWLLVDNNPFLAPWQAVIAPLTSAVPPTPGLTPRTPFSAVSGESTLTGDSLSPPQSAFSGAHGDQTITLPSRLFPNSGLTPTSAASSQPPYHIYTPSVSGFPMAPTPDSGLSAPSPLGVATPSSAISETPHYPVSATSYFPPTPVRAMTSTAPPKNRRTYADGQDVEVLRVPPMPPPPPHAASQGPSRVDGAQSDSEKKSLKKMKSADDVRKRARAGSVSAAVAAASNMFKANTQPVPALPSASPMASPAPSPGPNRLPLAPEATPERGQPPKFMSLAMRSGSSLNQSSSYQRGALTNSLWEPPENGPGPVTDSPVDMSDSSPRAEPRTYTGPPPSKSSQFTSPSQDDDSLSREKGRKWGFLKKMSMGKMRAAAAGAAGQETVRSNKSIKVTRPSTGQGSRPPSEFGQRAPARQFGQAPNSVVDSPAFHPPGVSPSASTASLNGGPKAVDLGSPALIPPAGTIRSGRRRSFLPLDGPPQLNIPIDKSPLMPTMALGGIANGPERPEIAVSMMSGTTVIGGDGSNPSSARQSYQEILINVQPEQPMSALSTLVMNEAYAGALRTLMVYLRDLFDLGGSVPALPSGAVPVPSMPPSVPGSSSSSPMPDRRRRPTLVGGEAPTDSVFSATFTPPNRGLRSMPSTTSLRGGPTVSTYTADSGGSGAGGGAEERKVKDDKAKRAYLVKEIVDTERTYVKQLQELIDIYINPSAQSAGPLTSRGETIVPGPERRIVFNGLEALFSFHMQNFLPALERQAAPLMSRQPGSEVDGEMSARVARDVAQVFVSHAAFMRMYSTYINNFDNCLARLKQWTTPPPPTVAPAAMTPNSSTAHVVGLGLSMSAMGAVLPSDTPSAILSLTNSQRKRIKEFLKRCRRNPKHSQLNLEGYLLLPVQRIPRYKLLLEQLVSSTPPRPDSYDDPIEKALEEISSLAMNMNEGKRESESRKKLVQWQTRIGGSSKFPSPLVQPHRRLVMDGSLKLSKVARKKHEYCQSFNANGEATVIQVEFLEVESTPRDLAAILCNDLLVLCKDPSKGKDKHANVDLWAVLRMQTLPQPASIVNGRHLRLVDHKAIMYFEMTSTSDALTWSRAINMHIPASRA